MPRPLITQEMRSQVIELLVSKHGSVLRGERFEIVGRLEDETVVVGLTLASDDRTFVYRMEAAMTVPSDGTIPTLDTLDICLDFLDWYVGEFFGANRETLLPLDWQPHRFGGHTILARGDVHNEVLDDLADAWLRDERPDMSEPTGRGPS